MTNEKKFDKVENLHIGNVYNIVPSNVSDTPELKHPEKGKEKAVYIVNVGEVKKIEVEPVTPVKQSPISDNEKTEYAEYMKKLRSHSSYRGFFKG